jgi:hypothetical protein
MRSIRFLPLVLVATVACGIESGAPAQPSDGAIITFAFDQLPDTMRVHVRDTAAIGAAERRVATGQGARMPVGPIVRGAGIDPRYPFHFLPESLRLAELAIELCDGRPMRTPEQVNEFFLLSTGSANAARATWCPWGARPIAVERVNAR